MSFPDELRKLREEIAKIREQLKGIDGRLRDLDDVQLQLLKESYRMRRWIKLAIRLYRSLRARVCASERSREKSSGR